MDKSTLVIRGSFKGISGNLVKNLLLLLGAYIVYTVASHYKVKFYSDYDIQSFFKFVIEFVEPKVVIYLFSIFLLYFILFIFSISLVFKIINLLYETQKVVTIDYVAGKIIVETYSFPLSKSVEEHKFNDIVSVSINQDFTSRIFQTGDLYIEYLTCSKVDSKLRNIEVTYISAPYKLKPKMI